MTKLKKHVSPSKTSMEDRDEKSKGEFVNSQENDGSLASLNQNGYNGMEQMVPGAFVRMFTAK